MKLRRLFFAVLFAGVLSSCGGGLPSGGLGAQLGGAPPQIHKNEDGENVELVLNPVPVWDETNAADSKTVEVGGREVFARVRQGNFLERPFAKAGLFWHSRKEEIFVPVVVLGPPVKINGVEVRAGGNFSTLRRAKNFKFTPAQSKWEKVSSAAFEMKPSVLRAVAGEKTARMTVKTNRGNLHLGLDVVGEDSEAAVRRSARYMFAQFAGKIAEVKKQ